MLSHSVMPSFLRPHGLHPARLLCPWGFSREEHWVVCHALLQGIFPTQRSNPGLPHCRWILYQLNHQGSHIYTYLHTNLLPWKLSCVKNLLAMQETQVWFLSLENPLEKGQSTNYIYIYIYTYTHLFYTSHDIL